MWLHPPDIDPSLDGAIGHLDGYGGLSAATHSMHQMRPRRRVAGPDVGQTSELVQQPDKLVYQVVAASEPSNPLTQGWRN